MTIRLLHGERLSQADHDQLARLISVLTGADMTEAARRVDDVQARIHQEEVAAAEGARKLAKYVSIWLAASLCFGALVAAGAAVSGGWVDDKARRAVRRKAIFLLALQFWPLRSTKCLVFIA